MKKTTTRDHYDRNMTLILIKPTTGKRPHKKIQRFGKARNIRERILLESEARQKYKKRVGQA